MKTRLVLVIVGVIGLVCLSEAFVLTDLWAWEEPLIDEQEVTTERSGLGESNAADSGEAFEVELGQLANDPREESSLLETLQSNDQELRNKPLEDDFKSDEDDEDDEEDGDEDEDEESENNPAEDSPEEDSEDEDDNDEDRNTV